MRSDPQPAPLLSAFTVNIIFVMLMITGAAMIPLLSLQLNPTRYLPSLTISWSWPEAPVRVVEQEVTTNLEGVLTTVSGVKDITSSTWNGGGNITVEFDRNVDLNAKRFEVASLLRESRKRLPERVSYPVISMNMPSNESGSSIMSLQLNGNASTAYIYNLAEEMVKPAISRVAGVYSVNVYGATPREWEVLYDQEKLEALGLSSALIGPAINNYLLERELGGADEIMQDGLRKRTYLTLTGNGYDSFSWDKIPVAKAGGRIVHLTDIASVKLKDSKPQSYYRINGLNTVNITISAGRNENTIKVAEEVKAVIDQLKKDLPPGYSIRISSDNTLYLKKEISKNIFRSVLSVVLLLLFVLAISRELKYLLIITISLVANILIAFIFYYLFRLEIHLYSLAGITVSFGIIINNTIVMADHMRYQGNRRVAVSLLAATATTIGALAVIFFLDEASRITLSDFAAVVIINLTVSLAVALFFIPSLIEKIGLDRESGKMVVRRRRRIVRFTEKYLASMGFITRHRKILIAAAILMFGLPVFFLPDKLGEDENRGSTEVEQETGFTRFYDRTLGNSKYVQDIKPVVNKVLGGTWRLFNEKTAGSRYRYYGGSDELQRTTLRVSINLAEQGLTAEDINNVCAGLENMLASYDEIDMFTTNIYNAEEALVNINFRPEHDFTIFPFVLKIRIEDYMNGIGSYNASVSGVGKAFSNETYSDYIMTSYKVIMNGYNYDQIYGYAEALRERLIESGKGRIKDVYILGAVYEDYMIGSRNRKVYRNRLGMDKYYLAESGTNVAFAYTEAERYSRSTRTLQAAFIAGERISVNIKSMQSGDYDLWSLDNAPLRTGTGNSVKLKNFATVTREISDNTISRENQQYILTVGFDFVGNGELGRMILDRNIDETNALLPLGFTARSGVYSYSWEEARSNYYLILLVILIIYFICAILLESFSQPFMVICLIPLSFIGVFLTFPLFNVPADEGVFAAFILLCGIVVNATLYILNDFNSLRRRKPLMPERVAYVKAFNGKIIPIILTNLATIIGLVPFLLTGKDERFWFALAAGTIGGLVFSMVGLMVFQPLMLKSWSGRKVEEVEGGNDRKGRWSFRFKLRNNSVK